MVRLAGVVLAVVLAVAVGALGSTSAHATFKGHNGLLAYAIGNGEEEPYAIVTVRADGTHRRQVLGPTSHYAGGAFGPEWSPDGKRLLFARRLVAGDYVTSKPTSLWYSTATGRHIRRIPLGMGAVALAGYGWTADGRHVIFAASHDSPTVTAGSAMLYTIRLDGTHRKALRRHGSSPEASSDGRRIVFVRRSEASSRSYSWIYVMRTNGTGLRRLTHSVAPDWYPSFAPDSRKVLFVQAVPNTVQYQWRVLGLTGEPDIGVLTRWGYCPPQWTPDGTRLIGMRQNLDGSFDTWYTELMSVSARGGDPRPVFRLPPSDVLACDISWQPVR